MLQRDKWPGGLQIAHCFSALIRQGLALWHEFMVEQRINRKLAAILATEVGLSEGVLDQLVDWSTSLKCAPPRTNSPLTTDPLVATSVGQSLAWLFEISRCRQSIPQHIETRHRAFSMKNQRSA